MWLYAFLNQLTASYVLHLEAQNELIGSYDQTQLTGSCDQIELTELCDQAQSTGSCDQIQSTELCNKCNLPFIEKQKV